MSTTAALPEIVPDAPPFPIWRFSVDDYHRLVKAGILSEDERVELLEGWIVPKMGHNPPHTATIELVDEALRRLLPAGRRIRIQSPVTLADSEPEPDLAIVGGEARDYFHRHPGPAETALVIEIADSSLFKDRIKRRLYARAGIAEYWIVNLVDGIVEVYTDPHGTGPAAAYRRRADYTTGGSVPLTIDGREVGQIAAGDFLR